MILRPVFPQDLKSVWSEVEGFIEAACIRGRGDDTAKSLLIECAQGHALLWVVRDQAGAAVAAVITQMMRQPGGRVICMVLACGGVGAKRWMHLLAEIEAAAVADGASGMRLLGRPGWARVLPEPYRITQLVYEKDLRH